MAMVDSGGSVTLIFYRIESVFNEPFINILAAAAQLSSFTHVELAIGDAAGELGQMKNVVRVFNDDIGVYVCYHSKKHTTCITRIKPIPPVCAESWHNEQAKTPNTAT